MHVAFLFDNDGVLIDSSALHWESWERLMEEEPDLKMSHEEFKSTFGMRNDLILQKLAPQASIERRQAWAERKEELFRLSARGNVELLPGMERFLQEVVAAEIPRIIASSTAMKNLEMYLESTVLGNYFEHALSAETVAHGKPEPDVFIAAAEKLGYAPADCVVFEDAPAGIEAGKRAGAFVVALETTHTRDALDHYDLIYPSPHALNLQEILKTFNLIKN